MGDVLYFVWVRTEWSDLDLHYEEELIGVYSTEEKARKALSNYKVENVDEDGRLTTIYNESYSFYIELSGIDHEYDAMVVYDEEDNDGQNQSP